MFPTIPYLASAAAPQVGLVFTGLLVLLTAFSVPADAQARGAAALDLTVKSSTGEPLSGAQVLLTGTGKGGLTNEQGWLRLTPLPAGLYSVEVRFLGYRTEEFRVNLEAGWVHPWEVVLEPQPIPLAEVRVETPPGNRRQMDFLRGFYERRARGLGYFLTREEIEEHGSSDLSNILRTVPGLRTSPSQFGQLQMRMARSHAGTRCRIRVYMDGMKYRNADDLAGIPTLDIEAIEVYRGRSELPAEFADGEADCGVIVLWSKRHRPDHR